ncbi:putative integral membrane protein [Rosellinia necatrix]|uniref:Putative integral membrane protein n=1 Tax=Rosellinia necatrix TaxID=77044 RepID=A0A1S7UP58_ROSNE|nr:putative integral membrane protein [Rosellinia necatrix]
MQSAASKVSRTVALLAIVSALPLVFAHGGDGGAMDMGDDGNMGGHGGMGEDPKPDPNSYPETYFAHQEYVTTIYAHIGLMVIGWVFLLPTAVMLSIARSRYTLAAQFLFLLTNAIGVLVGIVYNANTPDLYPNNAHHKLGWLVTWVVGAQVLVGLVGRVAGTMSKASRPTRAKEEEQSFIPVSTEAMVEHHRRNQDMFPSPYRESNDSGQGTERNTESLRSSSLSTIAGHESPIELDDRRRRYEDDEEDLAFRHAEMRSGASRSFVGRVTSKISDKAWRIIMFGYEFVDRTILILGYITLCTGLITYARFFEGHEVFSGLAHWIKGGIFFWYGILTLGRWSGSFGELGWAWNVRPKQHSQKWRPSAEFVEGALIFTYGSTNIFLEHLGNPESKFSSQDLEHVSITVLFIGGGLLAMLIESTCIRDLLNTTTTEAMLPHPGHAYSDEEQAALEPPRQYEFSINPIPALVILLLGIMMSSHTQQTMISSMVHKQWGNLLTGASFARGFTYVLLYLKPPRSVLPSRPPTELLTAFGLISGGTIFMASSGDTIAGMIHYDLDAMFFYTVTMGLVGLLMAWIVLLLAFKGWAVRRESTRNQTGNRRSRT